MGAQGKAKRGAGEGAADRRGRLTPQQHDSEARFASRRKAGNGTRHPPASSKAKGARRNVGLLRRRHHEVTGFAKKPSTDFLEDWFGAGHEPSELRTSAGGPFKHRRPRHSEVRGWPPAV